MTQTLLHLPTTDISLIRHLAEQVAGIAHEPRMVAIKQRWRDVNALRKPDRAPVWCRPVGCWEELLPAAALTCVDPWLRGIEYGFRQILIKREIDDDSPVEPYFDVPAALEFDPPNLWGVDVRHTQAAAGGAWAYDPPLRTEADFDRLRLPSVTHNAAKTEERLVRAKALFGDILPVRRVCHDPANATLGTAAADLRGLEQIMVDMYDAPELLHRLMAYLRDAMLGLMDGIEALGILTPNNEGPMTCSDPLDGAPGTYRASWCMANSQEFDQVSPAMWEEFCLEYQRPIFARCGLAGYGCCESLTHKLAGVLSIPNLRIVVCSAWTNLDTLLEQVSADYCIMWRQKASTVVFPDDTATIRRDLEDGLRRLQGRPYQIVLRELQTLAGHPDRLHVWTGLAKELAEQYT